MPEKEDTISSRPVAARLILQGATPARLENIANAKQAWSRAHLFAREMGISPRDQEWLAMRWGIDYPRFEVNW